MHNKTKKIGDKSYESQYNIYKSISPNIYIRNQDSFTIKNHIFNYKSNQMFQQNSLIRTITNNISMKITDAKIQIM